MHYTVTESVSLCELTQLRCCSLLAKEAKCKEAKCKEAKRKEAKCKEAAAPQNSNSNASRVTSVANIQYARLTAVGELAVVSILSGLLLYYRFVGCRLFKHFY